MRVTIVNLFYPPDLAPSAHLAASLADHRAALGDEVTVVAGTGSYLGGSERGAGVTRRPGDRPRGPRVIRLWTPALGKANTVRRLGDYFSFLVGAVARLLLLRGQDVVIALTSPPFILAAAVAHRLHALGSSCGRTTSIQTLPKRSERSGRAACCPGPSARPHDGCSAMWTTSWPWIRRCSPGCCPATRATESPRGR